MKRFAIIIGFLVTGCAPTWTVKKEVSIDLDGMREITKVYLCDRQHCYEVHSSNKLELNFKDAVEKLIPHNLTMPDDLERKNQ